MSDIDTFNIEQTEPPSPYHETTWDLKPNRVEDALRFPKDKKLGYLELYYQGFMEFVDDSAPFPVMSDDDEEYPRWGTFSTARDKASMSSTTSVASQEDLGTSITGDHDPEICHTPQRMASPDHKDLDEFRSATPVGHTSVRSRRYPKPPMKARHKHKLIGRRHAAVGRNRISKKVINTKPHKALTMEGA